MSSLKLLIDIASVIFEIYIIIFLYSCIFDMKDSDRKIRWLVYTICSLLLIISAVNPLKTFLPIISFMICFLILFFFEAKVMLKLLVSLITFSIFLVSEIFVGMVLTALTNTDVKTTQDNIILYFWAVLFSKFIVYIIAKVIEAKQRNKLVSLNFVISFLIMTVSSALIIYIIFLLAYHVTDIKIKMLVMIAAIILISANICSLSIIEKLSETKLREERLMHVENQLKLQNIHYTELTQKQTNITRIYHDLRNNLISISGYIKAKDYEKIKLEIEKISTGLFKNIQLVDTGDYCLDALIAAKITKINQLGINFKYSIILPSSLRIDSVDFCIIIGNALDNAIEACEKISNIDLRKITIKIMQSGEYVVVVVENSSIEGDYNKSLVTTKKNKTIHGFGIQSIQFIVKKYNGNVNFEHREKSFILKIIIENSII